ncbi:MAG: general stress protein [Bacillota bacterium]
MPTVLGVFDGEDQAQNAIDKLKTKGVSEEKISLIAKHQGENDDMEASEELGGHNKDRVTDGAATGGTLGGIAGILAGVGLLTIPGVGPILAAGPLAGGITGAAAGGITGGLVDYGLDEEAGEKYAQEVKEGKILVAAEDTAEEKIDNLAGILRDEGANDVTTH